MLHAALPHAKPNALGKQLIIELYDCAAEQFDDLEWVKQVMVQAATIARATIVEVVFHQFNPIGISGVVVISESHIALHTWPEHHYVALDIFTCGHILDGAAAIDYLVKQFQSARHTITEVKRGLAGHVFERTAQVNKSAPQPINLIHEVAHKAAKVPAGC